MSSPTSPNNKLELALVAAGHRFVLGVDEVGRGAIAGPVSVGIAVLDFDLVEQGWDASAWPSKLRDSKLISAGVRENLAPQVAEWLTGYSIGSASAQEIDQLGIVQSLALAGRRAFSGLDENLIREIWASKSIAILDGSHNWLLGQLGSVSVITQTKADRDCAVVAAASVLAKVNRDAQMRALATIEPSFGWDANKGYASSGHIDALRQLGPNAEHRKTWLGKILAENQLFDF